MSDSFDNVTAKPPFTDLYKIPIVVLYMKFELASAVILCVLSVTTVIPNWLLLAAVCRNPSRFFRTASANFIVGLAVADLITGLTTEPFFAAYYFARYLAKYDGHNTPRKLLRNLNHAGASISTIAISSSFVIVLALTWSQFVALSYPHKYKLWITKKRSLIFVVSSYIYFTGFTMIQFSGIDQETYKRIDLAIHPTLVSILLIVTLVLLTRAFRNKMKRSHISSFQKDSSIPNAASRKSQLERQFTIVTIYLAVILLASALLHVSVLHCQLYCKELSLKEWVILQIAMRVKDLLLFLKVSLDVFIYAWRLPSYRLIFAETIKCSTASKNYPVRKRSLSMIPYDNSNKA